MKKAKSYEDGITEDAWLAAKTWQIHKTIQWLQTLWKRVQDLQKNWEEWDCRWQYCHSDCSIFLGMLVLWCWILHLEIEVSRLCLHISQHVATCEKELGRCVSKLRRTKYWQTKNSEDLLTRFACYSGCTLWIANTHQEQLPLLTNTTQKLWLIYL